MLFENSHEHEVTNGLTTQKAKNKHRSRLPNGSKIPNIEGGKRLG